MPQTQSAEQIKMSIMALIHARGPCLPIHISKGINMSGIFSSAFLSELLNEKKLKMSHMRVGSSPIYYTEEQEPQLEMYAQHLKEKEKEAFFLLKENKFLKDKEMEPAIRVALRAIKDFAKQFNIQGETIWRFFTVQESDFNKSEIKREIKQEEKEEKIEIVEKIKENVEEIEKAIEEIPKKSKIKNKSKSKPKKQDDKFFNRVKEFLNQKSIELLDIEDFSKSEITLRVRQNKKELLIIAFNKKKLTDKDIISAYKTAQKSEMPYSIISLGETPKKLNDIVEASKALSGMEKLD